MHSLSHSAQGGFNCNLCDISFTWSDTWCKCEDMMKGVLLGLVLVLS